MFTIIYVKEKISDNLVMNKYQNIANIRFARGKACSRPSQRYFTGKENSENIPVRYKIKRMPG